MHARGHSKLLSLALGTLLTPACDALGADVSVAGMAKHVSAFFAAPEGRPYDSNRSGLSSTRFRLEGNLQLNRRLMFTAAYDCVPWIGEPPAGYPAGGGNTPLRRPYRWDDLGADLLAPKEDETVGVRQNLDRLLLEIRTAPGDIIVGRQAIGWGSARGVHALDVIAPFTFNALDTEHRRGVDALRVRIPFGFMGELDLGALAGHEGRTENNAYYARMRTYWQRTDLALLAMDFREHLLVGLDAARSLGGAGTWLEIAWVRPGAFSASDVGNGGSYWRLSTGADYSLTGGTYGFFEYHFNGAGAASSSGYVDLQDQVAYRDGAVYLLGRHYLVCGGSHRIDPLTELAGQVLLNVSDGSLLAGPEIRRSLSDNTDISAGAFWGFGPGPEDGREPVAGNAYTVIWRSEFGAYPDVSYLSFRVYF